MKRLVVGLMVCLACGVAMAQTQSPARVLIALEDTRFKKELVAEMKTILAPKGYQITVVEDSEKKIAAQSAAKFDAVFITNSGVMSKVRPWIVEWLKVNAASKDKILLHTTQQKDWKVVADVDVVTSASDLGIVKKLAAEYSAAVVAKVNASKAQ
jgi:hypothetical protein